MKRRSKQLKQKAWQLLESMSMDVAKDKAWKLIKVLSVLWRNSDDWCI